MGRDWPLQRPPGAHTLCHAGARENPREKKQWFDAELHTQFFFSARRLFHPPRATLETPLMALCAPSLARTGPSPAARRLASKAAVRGEWRRRERGRVGVGRPAWARCRALHAAACVDRASQQAHLLAHGGNVHRFRRLTLVSPHPIHNRHAAAVRARAPRAAPGRRCRRSQPVCAGCARVQVVRQRYW